MRPHHISQTYPYVSSSSSASLSASTIARPNEVTAPYITPTNVSTPVSSSRSSIRDPASRQRASNVHAEDVEWKLEGGTWRALCPRCNEWIPTGSHKARNVQPLRSHLSRKKDCRVFESRHARNVRLNQPSHSSSAMTSLPLLELELVTPSKFASLDTTLYVTRRAHGFRRSNHL